MELDKQEVIVPQKEPLKSHVIGYRGGAGYITWFSGLVFALGLLILGFCIFACFVLSRTLWIVLMPIIILSTFLVVIGSVLFVYMGINSGNNKDCIVYDEKDQKLVLTTITGREIRINPKDYVDLKDNFFTDNLLKFTFRNKYGDLEKVNLGYCKNREELRSGIKRVQDYLNNN